MSFLGKKVRLNRLFSKGDGLYLGLTVDHAMARGVMPGLDTIEDTLESLLSAEPDAITMHKGIAERCFEKYAGKVPLVLKCTTFAPYHMDRDIVVADVEEAVRFGADAVSVGCIVGGEHQPEQLHQLSVFCKEAQSVGMPVVSHIYPRGAYITKEDTEVWKKVAYATRMAAELGVDIIKTNYPGDPDSFHKIVEATPANVMVAGGTPGNTIESYFQMTRDVIDAGGKGVTYGRFVFQYEDPHALVLTLKEIIHNQMQVKEALEYLEELKHAKQ